MVSLKTSSTVMYRCCWVPPNETEAGDSHRSPEPSTLPHRDAVKSKLLNVNWLDGPPEGETDEDDVLDDQEATV